MSYYFQVGFYFFSKNRSSSSWRTGLMIVNSLAVCKDLILPSNLNDNLNNLSWRCFPVSILYTTCYLCPYCLWRNLLIVWGSQICDSTFFFWCIQIFSLYFFFIFIMCICLDLSEFSLYTFPNAMDYWALCILYTKTLELACGQFRDDNIPDMWWEVNKEKKWINEHMITELGF